MKKIKVNLTIHDYKGFHHLKDCIEWVRDYDFVANGHKTLVWDNEYFYAVAKQNDKSISVYWGREK